MGLQQCHWVGLWRGCSKEGWRAKNNHPSLWSQHHLDRKVFEKYSSRTKIDILGTLLRGVSYKKHEAKKSLAKGIKPILRANNINVELNYDDLVFVPINRINYEQYIKAGDILFAMSSGIKGLVGKSAQSKTDYDGSYGAFCGLYRPTELVNKRFLGFFFQFEKRRIYGSGWGQ